MKLEREGPGDHAGPVSLPDMSLATEAVVPVCDKAEPARRRGSLTQSSCPTADQQVTPVVPPTLRFGEPFEFVDFCALKRATCLNFARTQIEMLTVEHGTIMYSPRAPSGCVLTLSRLLTSAPLEFQAHNLDLPAHILGADSNSKILLMVVPHRPRGNKQSAGGHIQHADIGIALHKPMQADTGQAVCTVAVNCTPINIEGVVGGQNHNL